MHSFLARCYVVAKVYKVLYYVIQILLACRAHVHIMFTILQFLRQGQTFIQFLRAENMFIVSIETMGMKVAIPRFVCNIEALIPWVLPSGLMCFYFAYKPWELVNHVLL